MLEGTVQICGTMWIGLWLQPCLQIIYWYSRIFPLFLETNYSYTTNVSMAYLGFTCLAFNTTITITRYVYIRNRGKPKYIYHTTVLLLRLVLRAH